MGYDLKMVNAEILLKVLEIGFFISLLLIFFSFSGVVTNFDKLQVTAKVEIINISNYTQCKNLSLGQTANCLTNFISNFYNYNYTNINRWLSFEELKTQGGVCWHYAELYKQMGKELGFRAYTEDFYTNETQKHEITIIANEEGYCLLDQQLYNCVNLEK